MGHVLRRLALALFACAFAAGACQLIAGIDDRELASSPDSAPQDSATDGQPAPCQHAYPPTTASGPDDPVSVATAVYALKLTVSRRPDAGFDIDHVCTTPDPSTRSCTPVCSKIAVDDPEGRDNNAAVILSTFNPTRTSIDSVDGGENNRFRLLLQLSEYNGKAEDPRVKVEIFRSHGIAPVSPDAEVPPANDGNDTWTVTQDSYSLPNAAAVTTTGIVTGGRLFVTLDELDIAFGAAQFFDSGPAGHIRMKLEQVTISLPVPREDQLQATGGIVSGVWPVRQLLPALSSIRSPYRDDLYLCGADGGDRLGYELVRIAVCEAADLGAGTCDRVSIAFEVDAVRARRGGIAQLPDPSPGCGAEWTDDCAQPFACSTTE